MKHVILIPTYNESENIESIISRIFSLHPEIFIKVIDDNSPDGSARIVTGLMQKFPHLSLVSRSGKQGLGKAYTHGFKEVLSDPVATHVIMMDADMSHNPKYLNEMINRSQDFDLVIGSRYIRSGGTIGWEPWRKMLSAYGNLYARMVTRTPIHDLTGGFNCIALSALKKIDLDSIDSSGYAFQIELKYSLYRRDARITEIPIIFANRINGESKISSHIVSEGILAPWKMVLRKNKKI